MPDLPGGEVLKPPASLSSAWDEDPRLAAAVARVDEQNRRWQAERAAAAAAAAAAGDVAGGAGLPVRPPAMPREGVFVHPLRSGAPLGLPGGGAAVPAAVDLALGFPGLRGGA